MLRKIGYVHAALVLLCAGGLATAAPDLVYGPQNFELTAGQTEPFSETFASESQGAFVLYLRNGDGESTRVAAAKVSLNGETIVEPSELGLELPGLKRDVELQAGDNELLLELTGEPGSFVTVAVGSPDHRPRFIVGRLLLPWGRNDADRVLSLALRNGSPNFPRWVRVVFFRPDGEVAAASGKFPLPPRGSLALPVDGLIDAGSWQVGSVEVFYSGRGTARLFGSARQADLPQTQSEVQALEQAGLHVFRDPPAPAQNRPRRWP